MLRITRLLAAVMLLSAATAGAAQPLPDFQATYKLSRGAMKIGNSTIELINGSDGDYTYRSRSWPVRWVGWFLKDRLSETSQGKIGESGIQPVSYHYQRSGGSREREASLAFDWEQGIVENDVEESRWKMEIPPGTLDKLVSQLGMMLALSKGKTDITFKIADGGKLKDYRFAKVGEETLQLPAGTFDTVKLIKVRENNKRETYIWCAPELNYLPVRIWQREKDDSEYQSDLESFTDTLRIPAEAAAGQ